MQCMVILETAIGYANVVASVEVAQTASLGRWRLGRYVRS